MSSFNYVTMQTLHLKHTIYNHKTICPTHEPCHPIRHNKDISFAIYVIRNALYLVVIRSTLYAWDYGCEYFIYDRLLLTMHATCKIIQVPNKRYQLLENCNIHY